MLWGSGWCSTRRPNIAPSRELDELEAAWREAERVAAIAEDPLVPPRVRVFIHKHRNAGAV